MPAQTFAEFLRTYHHPERQIVEIDMDDSRPTPWIIVRHGAETVVLNPMGFSDHLCVDVHPFLNGEDTTAGVFGMTNGRRWTLGDHDNEPPTKSHGWPSGALVTVLVGKQTKNGPTKVVHQPDVNPAKPWALVDESDICYDRFKTQGAAQASLDSDEWS